MNILKVASLVVGLIASCTAVQAANPSTAHQPPTLRTFRRAKSNDVAVHFDKTSGFGDLAGVAMADGQPASGQRVELIQNGSLTATTISGNEGRFSFRVSKGGGYLLRMGSKTLVCRVWPAKAAPPAATAQVLLNGSAAVIRGQDILYDTGQPCETCDAPQGVACDCGSCDTCGSGNCGGGCGGAGGWFGTNTHLLWGLAGGAVAGFLIDENNDDDIELAPAS